MAAGLPGGGGDATEQAARWLSYLYSGAASERGMQAFSVWLERSRANRRAYIETQQLWRDLALVEGCEAARTSRDDIERAYGAPDELDGENATYAVIVRSNAIGIARWMAIAAALLIGLLVGGIWHLSRPVPMMIADYHTAIGETRLVTLPDGSVITLSASSSLRTEMSPARRNVVLIAGRAFFDVADDSSRPFTVDVGASRVRVVGTRFDVARLPDSVQILVTRGIVNVGPRIDWDSHKVRVLAGQKVTASSSGRPGAVQPFEQDRAVAWLHGMLVYRNEPLENVLADVNRYRTAKITISDGAIATMPITMAVRTDQTDTVISGLEAMRTVRIETTADGVVVGRKGASSTR